MLACTLNSEIIIRLASFFNCNLQLNLVVETMAKKKMVATRLDKDIAKKLKLLSVHAETTMNELFGEAGMDLLVKYEKLEKKPRK